MNTKTHRNKFLRGGRIITALLAGVFLISKTPAQPAAQPVENRFLLVFDTSSNMKKRLPAMEKALNTLLATNMRGQLHAGDSIGVWTFDRELHSGQFPLQRWLPENAATIASNITRFVTKQRYSKKTSFDALQPYLNWVAQNSDRLTVLIFCDGDGEITWTPFDSGINQFFQQRQAERKKARQPFILVLRSQLGNYVGCTMNFPPDLVNLPEFPPLPLPPEPKPSPPLEPESMLPPTNQPPPVVAPPLIIIGTKAGTNLPPPESTPVPPQATNVIANVETNLPSPAGPLKPTNMPAFPPANFVAQTNAPATPLTNFVARTIVAQTNVAAPPPKNSGLSSKKALAIGAAFLVLAGALTALMLGRSRKANHGSLITRSMNKDGKPPART
jgi:hypothetical protein